MVEKSSESVGFQDSSKRSVTPAWPNINRAVQWLSQAVPKKAWTAFRRPHPKDVDARLSSARLTRPYSDALHHAQSHAGHPGSWQWFPVLEADRFRCGLIRLEPESRIPAHDHIDLMGALLVIQGSLEISHYALLGESVTSNGVVQLCFKGMEVLGAGDRSYVDGYEGDIHGLRNPTAQATMFLDLIWHGGSTPDRHFFFFNTETRPRTLKPEAETAVVVPESRVRATRVPFRSTPTKAMP